MKANTAFGLVLAGASLWLLRKEAASRPARLVGIALGGAVAALAALTVVEYVFGADLAIDHMFSDPGAGVFDPGRASPHTAAALLGVGLWLVALGTQRGAAHRVRDTLSVVACVAVLLAGIGYLFQVEYIIGNSGLNAVAPQTIATLGVLCWGVLAARPEQGVMGLLTSVGPGGHSARRLIPVAIVLPMAVGFAALQAQELALIDPRDAVAIVGGALIIVFGATVIYTGLSQDRADLLRRGLELRLQELADHDPLTNLLNRRRFHDRLDQALRRARRSGSKVAVMLLDLDQFKEVNDSLGHAVGDMLLVVLAPRLQSGLGDSGCVARLGGDEFGFLVEDFDREQELLSIAERLLAKVAEPVTIDHSVLQITASLGITIAESNDTAESALSHADAAMYKAKGAGRGCLDIYDDAMRSRMLRDLTLTKQLAAALQENRLEVYYQPIVSLTDGRILGLEALARWNHPEWGWISPGEFIPLAEDHGLIITVGQSILTEIARQVTAWRTRYPNALKLGIFVNVSSRQLSRQDFVETFVQTLNQHGTSLQDIGIEITERALINHDDRALADNLARLTRLGVRLSLDDFGTGYSSLAAVKTIPLTALKIDASFIEEIRHSTDLSPLSNAAVSLAHALGLTVIGEGVETQIQADYLTGIGCDAAQGFHYARPQPANQTTALLESERKDANQRNRQQRWRSAA